MNRHVLVSGMVVALSIAPERPSFAHAACTEPTCCSPHGVTSSTFGSTFTNCSYDGSVYSRDYLCTVGACAHPVPDLGCQVENGRSHGHPDHSPVTYSWWEVNPFAAASTETLWPPNHEFVTVTVDVVTLPSQPTEYWIVGVTDDESNDGDDVEILDDHTVRLRAERDGSGDGRIYTIAYAAEDTFGNSCTDAVTVCVPHDQASDCAD